MVAIKQGLELKQTQRLSPLQIQTVKLIELPIQQLEQAIKDEFDSNPVLDDTPAPEKDKEENEEPKDVSIDELDKDDPIPYYNYSINNQGKDAPKEYNTFSVKESFTDTLLQQLGFRRLTDHEMAVGRFIICSLDEDGYLKRDIESLVDDMAFRQNIETDEDEVLKLLEIIQEFDPAGVGARDLRECLLLQLDRLRPVPEVENAKALLTDYFKEFTSKHFSKIAAKMGLTMDELKAAIDKIVHLNPYPGGQVDDSYTDAAQQIIPDFKLRFDENGQRQLEMPRFKIPEVRVNRRYSEMMADAGNNPSKEMKDALVFVKQKIDSANSFVMALKQRQETLMKTMNAILDFQEEFFKDGDEAMLRPMVLKDIAEVTGYDISTISRVVNSKYIDTPFGIFLLKYFFSEGMENSSGEEISTRGIKKALRELVDAEDKSNPLTDEELVDKMTAKGFKVARRTIAKYRDQLSIPMARLRREI